MATLSVWKFNTPEGAQQAETTVLDLQKSSLITVHDAAVVTWPADKKKPQTKQLNSLAGSGALGGGFWGLLFGLLFFVPFLGAALGAASGALAGALSDVGIDDGFIKRIRERVTPGTSALFLMSSDAVIDRVRDAFGGTQVELVETNLSKEEEEALRAAFTEQ